MKVEQFGKKYFIPNVYFIVDKEAQAGVPNLNIYNIASGKCVRSLIQKKATYW